MHSQWPTSMEASIYTPVTLVSVIQHIVQRGSAHSTAPPPSSASRDSPILIIACCTRKVFQAHLLSSILEATRSADAEPAVTQDRATEPGPDADLKQPKETPESPAADEARADELSNNDDDARLDAAEHPLLKQTLRTLFASATIKMAFCNSTPVLYAYLTVLANASLSLHQEASAEIPAQTGRAQASTNMPQQKTKAQLILLNPLAMHRNSASYSAQGLSQTFAAAYEAAWRMGRALVVVETTDAAPAPVVSGVFTNDEEFEVSSRPAEVGMERYNDSNAQQTHGPQENKDPWDAEVPIVNVTTKRFGSAAERAQLARKTTIRHVASRWFTFQRLP